MEEGPCLSSALSQLQCGSCLANKQFLAQQNCTVLGTPNTPASQTDQAPELAFQAEEAISSRGSGREEAEPTGGTQSSRRQVVLAKVEPDQQES